jgi:hypothetical protein
MLAETGIGRTPNTERERLRPQGELVELAGHVGRELDLWLAARGAAKRPAYLPEG